MLDNKFPNSAHKAMQSVLLFVEILQFVLLGYAMITTSTAICVIISNIISAVFVFIYCVLQAPDIAITEAVIGTATSTILFALTLLYIKKLPTNRTQNIQYVLDLRLRLFVFILCTILFSLIVHAMQNMPITRLFPRIADMYVENTTKDFGFDSIVTAVVAGYRAFDTMFENVVIFTACYGFYTLLSSVKLNNMDDKAITDDEIYNYDIAKID